MRSFWSLGALGLSATLANAAFPSYPNEFVPPKVLLSTPEVWSNTTRPAQASIVKFADEVLREGPWCECSTTRVDSRHDFDHGLGR
jgi:hypothetical protein